MASSSESPYLLQKPSIFPLRLILTCDCLSTNLPSAIPDNMISWSSTLDIDYNMDPSLSCQPGKSVFPPSLDTYGPLDTSLTVPSRSAPDRAEEHGRLSVTADQGIMIPEPASQPYSTVQRPLLVQSDSQYGLQFQSRDIISRAPSENMHMAALALEDIAFGRTVNTHREIGSTGGHVSHGEFKCALRQCGIAIAKAWTDT
jgi:hypothetical protein